MTHAGLLALFRPELDAVLEADPWGQVLPIHTDRGQTPPRVAGGWVEAWLDIDSDVVPRAGLTHLAAETDGRYMVALVQPVAHPESQLEALGDAIVSRFRGRTLGDVEIEQILPGSGQAHDAHRGYRVRLVVVFWTARTTHEVIP